MIPGPDYGKWAAWYSVRFRIGAQPHTFQHKDTKAQDTKFTKKTEDSVSNGTS
jgi:hypothetical protein